MADEKILLVVGASSDIGTALIKRVCGSYDKILAHCSKGADKIKALADAYGDKIVPLTADMGDIEEVRRMTAFIADNGLYPQHIVHFAFPRIKNVRFHQSSAEEFSKMFDCSVAAFAEMIKPLVKVMSKNGEGRIAVMLTAYTENIPPKFLAPYVTVKYALLGLVKALAAEYADKGICVNGVSPEMTDTGFLAGIPRLAVEQTAAQSVMGRLLTVDEVVPTFEYLLSDAASRVTGQNILISGVK